MTSTRATHLVLRFCGRTGHERRLADEHFVQYDADAPPIAELGVAGPGQHFRGDIVGRADQRVSEAPQMLPPSPPLQRFEVVTAANYVVVPARIDRVLPAVLTCEQKHDWSQPWMGAGANSLHPTIAGSLMLLV